MLSEDAVLPVIHNDIHIQSLVDHSTLTHLLRWRAQHQADQRAYTFLVDGETKEAHLTYGELDRQARAIAAVLQQHVAVGDRAVLIYPQGLEFIAAFFGCLYSGVAAIPVSPPRVTRLDRSLPRLQAIVRNARPSVVLTTTTMFDARERLCQFAPEFQPLHWFDSSAIANGQAESWAAPAITGDTLVFLQYTSGSTALPKGVMVSHTNLLHNLAYLDRDWEHTPDSVLVSWLPTFHDMGLIYGVLEPVYTSILGVLMSPMAFLQKPSRWLQAISTYRGTHTGAPNFAYDLCAQKVTPEQRATLDLSSWRVALNGAEPVRKETLERFFQAFAPYGFRWTTFCPGYGLAEGTLKVVATRHNAEPAFCTAQADLLQQKRIVEASPTDEDARTLVGCGQAAPDVTVAIVEPETQTQCPDECIGEIWVSSPSVAQGYWDQPGETEQTFRAWLKDTGAGPFLRTGDLGFLRQGELFITGRIKDLIIVDGRNHYPQDIEQTVDQSHPAIRQSCCAAFPVDVEGEERVVVVVEIDRHYQLQPRRPGELALDPAAVIKAIRRSVSVEHDIELHEVVLLNIGGTFKTSSGKIQRRACKAAYLAKTLDMWGE